jgi:fluoride exporter
MFAPEYTRFRGRLKPANSAKFDIARSLQYRLHRQAMEFACALVAKSLCANDSYRKHAAGVFLFVTRKMEEALQKILLLAGAGALGTLARYGLSGVAQRFGNGTFPTGTLAVNLLGSFLFGLIWAVVETRMVISSETRTIVLTGFMGAFTTFSTYMFETGGFLESGQWSLAILNLLAQNGGGIVSMLIGLTAGQKLM